MDAGGLSLIFLFVWTRLIWTMDAGGLSLILYEDTVKEEEKNIIY